MENFFKFLVRQLDALVYGFVGPLTVLLIVPKYLLGKEKDWGIILPIYEPIKYIGIFLMNFGGILAIWCTLIMFLTKNAPSIFSKPQRIVQIGPYKVVRHPMMWALFFVLTGEVFAESSLFVLIWLVIFVRFSVIYIKQNEEPLLVSVFGEEYIGYCKKVPRWFPKFY